MANKNFINSAKAFMKQLNQVTEATYASIGLAMWEMGYEQDEIADVFARSQQIWDEHDQGVEGMILKCEEETGICIKPKKEAKNE